MYDDNYEGQAESGSTLIAADARVRLEDRDCKYVQLSVTTVLDGRVTTAGAVGSSTPFTDNVLNAADSRPDSIEAASEIFYAFGDTQDFFGQLFPGQRTELIPVSNLKQIIVRCHPGKAGVIRWTIFK